MLQQGSTESVDIRVRIFNFADFPQNSGYCIKALSCQITNVVISNVFISESFQVEESWVSISQHCMPVAWHDSAILQGFVHKLLNDGLIWLLSVMEIFEGNEPF